MTFALLILLKIGVGLIIFGIGLDSAANDAARLFRHPGLLLPLGFTILPFRILIMQSIKIVR